jgi:hypothetical protein
MIGTFLALAVAVGLILPSFEAMDEPQHFNFARYLAEGRGLPDQRNFELAESYGFGQEGGQAPLYYLLSALILRGLDQDMGDVPYLTVSNPLSTCGETELVHSKGLWMRRPRREMRPYHGAVLGVHVLRLFSTLLGGLTILGVYQTARAAFPRSSSLALMAAALVSFNPRFITHSATVTNDSLLAAVTAWGLYLTVEILRRGPSLRRSLALGVVVGLASLTKVGGFLLLPLVGLALVDRAWRRGTWVRAGLHGLGIGLLGVLVAGWWYGQNYLRYGDPGLVPLITHHTGQRAGWPARLVLPEVWKIFYSYWAGTPYCEIGLGYLPVYLLVSLVGVGGLLARLRHASSETRRVMALLAIWVGVIFLAWFRFNMMVWAPDGRYFFQANAAVASLLAAGIMYLVGRWSLAWRGLIMGLSVLALTVPVARFAPLFALPVRKAPAHVRVGHPLEASFGEAIQLLGYDVSAETVRAGDGVDVTLYLMADRPVEENGVLQLQLKSAGPYDDALLSNVRTWPGGGNYPTSAWQPGEVVVERYAVPIPAGVPELQLWDLRLVFTDGETGALLPVRVGGVPGASYVNLTQLRVEPSENPKVPEEATFDAPPAFGPQREVTLAGARTARRGERFCLDVWWRVHKPMAGDYTVFVHLLDEEGAMIVAGDERPRQGAMPTSAWRAGDLIADQYCMVVPAEGASEGRRVELGFYNAEGRLPAWSAAGEPLAHQAFGLAVTGE